MQVEIHRNVGHEMCNSGAIYTTKHKEPLIAM